MHIYSLNIFKCSLEENILPSNFTAQVTEEQTKALIIRLTRLQQKLKSQSWWASTVNVRNLSSKEWDSEPWDGDRGEDPTEGKILEPSD